MTLSRIAPAGTSIRPNPFKHRKPATIDIGAPGAECDRIRHAVALPSQHHVDTPAHRG
jgi:hypothetical protein